MTIESSIRVGQSSPIDYGEQDENGIDLSLIRENLKLSPLARIRQADAARRQALLLMEYGRRHLQGSVRADH
jgi:hypothetical protein